MKIKLDENLPSELGILLSDRGHDVHTVADEQLTGHSDEIIFQTAAQEGRLLITQDLDFADIRRYQPGTHTGIVLVRLRDPNRRTLMERMKSLVDNEDIESWARCFIVVGDKKLRIRRP